MRLGNAVYILARPCAQLSIRGPIAKEKRENRHWELPISLPHAHIPRGKHNAQMTFCKVTNWRAPALGKLCVFVFISSTCPNMCPAVISCVRVGGHVFIRASAARQARFTEGLGAGFGPSAMHLIFPTSALLEHQGRWQQ